MDGLESGLPDIARSWLDAELRCAFELAGLLVVEDDIRELLQLAESPTRAQRSLARRGESGRPGDDGRSDCPGPIELILYVTGQPGCSANAIAQIRHVVSREFSDTVTLTICEVAADPSMTAPDCTSLSPAHDSRGPGPRTFILGHATNPDLLMELLEDCQPSI